MRLSITYGDYHDASCFFRYSLTKPKRAYGLLMKGICHKFLQQHAEAATDIEKSLELDPDMRRINRHMHGYLGDVAALRGGTNS